MYQRRRGKTVPGESTRPPKDPPVDDRARNRQNQADKGYNQLVWTPKAEGSPTRRGPCPPGDAGDERQYDEADQRDDERGYGSLAGTGARPRQAAGFCTCGYTG